MGRTTVYNNITSEEKLAACNKNNIKLGKEFLEYLKSIDRSETTIQQYSYDLNIFWCWNHDNNDDKDFIKVTKRNFAAFQNCCLNTWEWSSSRIRRVKSTLSSLSNFIENILDEEEEFEGYKSIVKKIESPVNDTVREKSIFTNEELNSLLDWLVDDKQYMKACLVSLAMNSGRRKAELPRFKVSYFEDKNIMFDGAMFKTDEKVKTKGRGKGKFVNLYVLRKPFLPYLELWMKQREELGIKSQWLFPKKQNGVWLDEPIDVYTISSWTPGFSKFLNKPFYMHSLRHYFTTYLSNNNIPSSVIQEIIAWDSADMVNLYDDSSADESIAKYFGADGIKNVEKGTINNLS